MPSEFGGFTEGMFTLFLALLGDFGFLADLEQPTTSYYFQNKQNITTIKGVDPQFKTYKVILAQCFFVVFGLIVNLILVNLLIAHFSNTYAQVESHSEAEFYKRRSERIHVVEGTLSRHVRRSLYTDVPTEICVWESINDEPKVESNTNETNTTVTSVPTTTNTEETSTIETTTSDVNETTTTDNNSS